MYHGIIFTECTSQNWLGRGYGVHRLATELRKHGFDILVIDWAFAVNFDLYKEILDLSISEKTVFVGFSTSIFPYRMQDVEGQKRASLLQHSYNRESADDFLKLEREPWYCEGLPMQFANGLTEPWLKYIKEKNPKTKIVFGGSKTWEYFGTPLIDHFFVGMSETMFVDWMLSMTGKGPKKLFNTIIDYDIKAQGNKEQFDFTKSTTLYQPEDFIQPYEALGLEVGRGCRFQCSFCTWPLIGQKNINDYLKTPDLVRKELIDNWEKWGIWKYYITDDTFNDSTEKLEVFNAIVKSLPFKPAFWGFFRLDLIYAHQEQIKLIQDSGFRDIVVGIETFNPQAGKYIKKGSKSENLKKALEICKEQWGDEVLINSQFITGLPGENSESIAYSAEWFNREDAPIDGIGLVPLRLYAPDKWEKFRVTSEFERNYQKYGYSFPDPVNRPWYWEKDDGTDIRNYDDAKRLAEHWENILRKIKKPKVWLFKHTSFGMGDMSYEYLKSLSQDEYKKIPRVPGNMLMIKDQVMKDYFVPLIKFLKEKNEVYRKL
jgi:hypothetical protein